MPTFMVHGKECVSAGVIPYHIDNGTIYVFLQKHFSVKDPESFIYEDWGGKADPEDKCIEDVAAREIDEETNGVLKREWILKTKSKVLLINDYSKYALFMVPIATKLDPELVGDHEDTKQGFQIKRIGEWLKLSDVVQLPKKQCHARMRPVIKKFYKYKTSKPYNLH